MLSMPKARAITQKYIFQQIFWSACPLIGRMKLIIIPECCSYSFLKTENHLGNLCYRDFAEVTLTHRRSPRWLNSKIFLPPPDPPLQLRSSAKWSCGMPISRPLSDTSGRSPMLRRCDGLKTCMDEKELGQRAHALPQLTCFWWIRSWKVKNFRTGLFQVHRRSRNTSLKIFHFGLKILKPF